ncbi:glycosyltransferase [Candidatus Sumerlaeota bacterium]|nr:glycosyltransferase [Candidatus Sumerlaeota bacterium]
MKDESEKYEPLVSIVIPAYNCEKSIAKCLDSLFKIKYPHYEIIIVNDGSTDSTGEILKRYGSIRVITIENSGPSKARNIGTREAKGDFIAYTDSDCIVSPEWLDELYKGFQDERTAGVGGDQQSPEDETFFGKNIQDFMKAVGFVSDYMKTGDKLIKTRHNPTCNVMYRKKVLLDAGLFDEKLWPGEDVDIDLKITRSGYDLYFNPRSVVYHYRPQTSHAFSRMMRRYGWAQGYLVKKYGLFRFIHYVPLILITSIVSILATCALGKTGLAFIAVFLCMVYPFILFMIRTRNCARALSYYDLFFRLLWNWNIGFFKGLIRRSKT